MGSECKNKKGKSKLRPGAAEGNEKRPVRQENGMEGFLNDDAKQGKNGETAECYR